jgi:hypothetical protein
VRKALDGRNFGQHDKVGIRGVFVGPGDDEGNNGEVGGQAGSRMGGRVWGEKREKITSRGDRDIPKN